MVIISGAALAVSLPMAAFAVTPDTDAADAAQMQDQAQSQDQEMVRQRLQVHIETGPPEDFDPVQQRLHRNDAMGVGNADAPMGNQDAQRGNPDAPMLGDGTGDCTQDGEPMGTGPHGPGGHNNG